MPSREFRFPALGTRTVGRAILLAIDNYSLPLRRNLCYYITKPTVRPEPVLTPSRDNPQAPDHIAAHFYGTVLLDGGRYRMWYYPVAWKDRPGDFQAGPMCYAESADGLHWTKPNLGQYEWKGSRANNAFWMPDGETCGFNILKEDDDPDPQRRYKLVYEKSVLDDPTIKHAYPSMRTATSPDGIHWTFGEAVPIRVGMEQSSFYRFNGLYYVNAQMWPRGEGGRVRGRQGHVAVSPDFDHWLPEIGESFLLPEPADPADCGNAKPYDQVHLGVGAVSLGNVLVGLYCTWHDRPNPGDWFGTGTTSGDLGLLVSNDGQHFREPVKGHVWLHRRESPCTPVREAQYYEQILCQAHGILNVGDETRIYHGRWANTYPDAAYYGEIALATLPRDRWGALGLFPEASEGSVWSAPVTLPSGSVDVTLNAEGVHGMRAEIADERFTLLADYSGDWSGTADAAGGLDCKVSWPRGSLTALRGRTVRFRVQVKKEGDVAPRLYAVYLA